MACKNISPLSKSNQLCFFTAFIDNMNDNKFMNVRKMSMKNIN